MAGGLSGGDQRCAAGGGPRGHSQGAAVRLDFAKVSLEYLLGYRGYFLPAGGFVCINTNVIQFQVAIVAT
jgi:hypothetical protein